MEPAPESIDNAKVICFTPIDSRHRHTGNCSHIIEGALQGAVSGLAICQYKGDSDYFLFGCDAEWEPITNTWHQTIEEAKEQADFEYEGASETWTHYD